MIDTKKLRRLCKCQQWIGRWYDAGCETLMAERDGEHEEVAHPMPIGLVPYLVAVQPAAISELLDRLEAAEKAVTEAYQRGYATGQEEIAAELKFAKQEIANLHDDIHELTDERDALRAKIEAVERQEPVAWLHETRRDSDVVTNAVKHVWGKAAVGSMAAYSIPLYALPGAQGEEK